MQLISAVAALALIIAQVLGAYAHAAGHDHAQGHAACAGHHAVMHGNADAAPSGGDPGAVDKGHHDADRSLIASCDFLCHGGVAILVTLGFEYQTPVTRFVTAMPAIADPSPPPSLERPPRSSVSA